MALSPADEDMVMFVAMYALASPDGPEHFPEVWEKVRTMWVEPFDWTAKVQRISAPTLVIVGDDDYVSVEHAQEFSRTVENGQLAVVPGASHLAPMEKPDLFNQLVLDFTANPFPETMMPNPAQGKQLAGARPRSTPMAVPRQWRPFGESAPTRTCAGFAVSMDGNLFQYIGTVGQFALWE